MNFITFHANSKNQHLGSQKPDWLINLLFRSASIHYSGCQKTLLTDLKTVFSGLDEDIQIKRFDVDPQKIMFARMLAQVSYAENHDFSSDLVFLDSDMLINGNWQNLDKEDFDIALTYRTKSELPAKRKDLSINGGVIILKKLRKNQCLTFMKQVLDIFGSSPEEKNLNWWGDQYALAQVVGCHVPEQGSKTIRCGPVKVLFLPCHNHNYTPPDYRSIRSELKDKKIIHFKGKRKKWMSLYWDIYLAHRQKPGLISTVRALARRIQLKFLDSSDRTHLPDVDISIERNHSILQKIIQGQKILILGSGPSAQDLKTIPQDFKIFSCNAGPRILSEKQINKPINLFFVIKTKASKSIVVGGSNEKKMDAIENILCSFPIKLVVSNKPDYAQKLKKLKKLNYSVLTDNGRDTRYLQPLIAPQTLADIKGSSPIGWTSSGIRLLQYALFFGAQEIYLCGIDLGQGGYFWGPNLNPWRHPDIDENFLKIIASRHSNVYSASRNSPAGRYLPFKAIDGDL